jgi:hypothetical protein
MTKVKQEEIQEGTKYIYITTKTTSAFDFSFMQCRKHCSFLTQREGIKSHFHLHILKVAIYSDNVLMFM